MLPGAPVCSLVFLCVLPGCSCVLPGAGCETLRQFADHLIGRTF